VVTARELDGLSPLPDEIEWARGGSRGVEGLAREASFEALRDSVAVDRRPRRK